MVVAIGDNYALIVYDDCAEQIQYDINTTIDKIQQMVQLCAKRTHHWNKVKKDKRFFRFWRKQHLQQLFLVELLALREQTQENEKNAELKAKAREKATIGKY